MLYWMQQDGTRGIQRKWLEQCLRRRLGLYRSWKTNAVDAMLSQTLLWIADWTQGEAFFQNIQHDELWKSTTPRLYKVTHFVYS
jgi:hypothetical protein